jgi:hypothetical protein
VFSVLWVLVWLLQASVSADPEIESADRDLANALAAWVGTAVTAAGGVMESMGVVGALACDPVYLWVHLRAPGLELPRGPLQSARDFFCPLPLTPPPPPSPFTPPAVPAVGAGGAVQARLSVAVTLLEELVKSHNGGILRALLYHPVGVQRPRTGDLPLIVPRCFGGGGVQPACR